MRRITQSMAFDVYESNESFWLTDSWPGLISFDRSQCMNDEKDEA